MFFTSLKNALKVSIVLMVTACSPPDTIEQIEHRLAEEHSLIIRAGDPDTFYVPPYSSADAKLPEGKAFTASPTVLHESLKGVEDALNCYPKGFVSSLIKAIFISGELWFDGERAGGTYGRSWLIVASSSKQEDIESNYNSAFYGVHHELSSFVINRWPMVIVEWGELMPAGWEPTTSYSKALGVDRSAKPDYANGFLSKYAETSVENDFNTYAEFAFGRSDELVDLAGRYPLVAKKLRLFIDAYMSTSPEMAAIFEQSSLEMSAAELEPFVLKFNVVIPKPTVITGK